MENINSMNIGGQLSMIEDTAAREMEAKAYDPTQTYAKEDICIYNDKLYEANAAIATPEAFNIAHWTETTLGKIAQKHRDSISQLTEKKLDKNYIETTVTTDASGRAEVPYKADKIINCTVADGAYIAIPRFLSREKSSCLVYLYTVDDLKKVPNKTVILQIRYID